MGGRTPLSQANEPTTEGVRDALGEFLRCFLADTERQLTALGFLDTRCLLSSTLLLNAIEACWPQRLAWAERWEGSVLVMDKKLFDQGQKCLLSVKANAPDLGENELGGHVAVIVHCVDGQLLVDPTSHQFNRRRKPHGWNLFAPKVLIESIESTAEISVSRAFGKTETGLLYTREAIHALQRHPDLRGWSSHQYTELQANYTETFRLAWTSLRGNHQT